MASPHLVPPFWRPTTLVATWFGSGLLPRMPGTWGSLVAAVCAWPLVGLGGWPLLAAASLLLFPVGIWASRGYVRGTASDDPGADQSGAGDPGEVVVDEVVGQWIALLPLAYYTSDLRAAWPLVLLAFVLFRLFDIWKPFPIDMLDRTVKGGLGIMIDDAVAGLYAAVVFVFLGWIFVLAVSLAVQ